MLFVLVLLAILCFWQVFAEPGTAKKVVDRAKEKSGIEEPVEPEPVKKAPAKRKTVAKK